MLKDRLEQAIAHAQRNRAFVGVYFIDIDDFKLVNDSLGHAVGDLFLKNVANTLQASVRDVDTVVRFGGDEFIVIAPDVGNQDDMVSDLGIIAKKILGAVQTEFNLDNHVLHPKVSIGIAAYPKDGHVAEELIRHADAAMYLAKKKGRSRYEFFAPELNAIALRRLNMEQELRDALICDEFVMYYQPKVDCHGSKLTGAEALIRWNHPKRGLVMPNEFINIAEESGLILDIGKWIISSVCRQITAWQQAGLSPVPVAINVSAQQFSDGDFSAILFDILDSTGVKPELIELEITESMVMNQTDAAISKLGKLRAEGVRLSMDDFGTGYSSLSYLRRLPIHTLKIDKSFIDGLVADRNSYAIISATVFLAHKLGLQVVAEGVESGEQQRLLQGMKCDTIQGYLVSKPLPADIYTEQFLGDMHHKSQRGITRV